MPSSPMRVDALPVRPERTTADQRHRAHCPMCTPEGAQDAAHFVEALYEAWAPRQARRPGPRRPRGGLRPLVSGDGSLRPAAAREAQS